MSVRDRIIHAGTNWCAHSHGHGSDRASLNAAREALLIAKERLLSNTEAVPPYGMLTPMQVAAAQIDVLVTELSDGNQGAENG